nr:hypothetical protein [Leptotrichia sp. oral taxon 879]
MPGSSLKGKMRYLKENEDDIEYLKSEIENIVKYLESRRE